jgi:hypothetical protein
LIWDPDINVFSGLRTLSSGSNHAAVLWPMPFSNSLFLLILHVYDGCFHLHWSDVRSYWSKQGRTSWIICFCNVFEIYSVWQMIDRC